MSEQKVIIGNCLDVLRGMPDESVDVCVTSPPYWALRDYGSEPVIWGGKVDCEHEWTDHRKPARGGISETATVTANKDNESNNRGHPTITQFCSKCGAWKGQLGLEPSPSEYVEHLLTIFDEVKRVLKPTGACWVNLGDTYATVSGSGFQNDNISASKEREAIVSANELRKGLKAQGFREKSLCQIPSRFSIGMTDRGWILRNSCIWTKQNIMPTSTKDRFTVDYEMFYFFVKEPKYYFKQQFEPVVSKSVRSHRGLLTKNTSKWLDDDKESSVRQGMNQNRGSGTVEKRYGLPEQDVLVRYLRERTKAKDIVEGTDIPLTKAEHWFRCDDVGFAYPSAEDWVKIRDRVESDTDEYRAIDKGLTDITYESDDIMKNSDGEHRNARCVWNIPTKGERYTHCAMFPLELIRRPIDSYCPDGGIVLDPFAGSGTVLEYCYDHDTNAIGIEINPEFEPIIKKRMRYGQTRLDLEG